MSGNVEPIYFNQPLFKCVDKQITLCSFSIDQTVIKDEYYSTAPKLRISIRQPKSSNGETLFIQYQELYQFLLKFRSFEDDVKGLQKSLVNDINTVVSYQLKFKSNLYITILNRVEYNGICVRIVITKNETYTDSTKVFISLYDFAAMLKMLTDYRNNYCFIASIAPVYITMDAVAKNISELSEKMSTFRTDLLTSLPMNNSHIDDSEVNKMSSDYNPFENGNSSSTDTNNDNENSERYDELNKYLKENKDTIKIADLNEIVAEDPVANESQAVILDSAFTESFLKNDLMNLEMYLTNISNEDVPFNKWRQLIEKKLSINIFDGCMDNNVKACEYIISCMVKKYIKSNIEDKKEFPGIVSTVIVPNIVTNSKILSVVYDLLLYFIYYGQLRNILKEKDFNAYNNKEFITFMLKALSAPIVLSNLYGTNQETMCSEIVNRYRTYRNNGVFKNLESSIFDKYSLNFTLDETYLRTEIGRLYNAFLANRDKLTIDVSFSNFNFVKLSYSDFKNNNFNDEQIKKMLTLEFDKTKLLSSDGLAPHILEKYGINQVKIDNTNLKRYVKEQTKDNMDLQTYCLEIVSNVNESYQDLLDKKYDYASLPENILKAIYLWDIKKDNKVSTNYMYFCELINKSSLEKAMLISLITTKLDSESVDFVGSFKSSMDER